jgi:hypothetical protein
VGGGAGIKQPGHKGNKYNRDFSLSGRNYFPNAIMSFLRVICKAQDLRASPSILLSAHPLHRLINYPCQVCRFMFLCLAELTLAMREALLSPGNEIMRRSIKMTFSEPSSADTAQLAGKSFQLTGDEGKITLGATGV